MCGDDEWPTMPDGSEYDGKHLMEFVRNGKSPFGDAWDVMLLVREVEENLKVQVTDIPIVDKGSNNYVGLCFQDPSRVECHESQSDLCLGFPSQSLEQTGHGDSFGSRGC